MGVRDTIRTNAVRQNLLRPSERVESAFPAQAVSPFWALLTWLIVMVANGYRAIVVTDQRILVCRGGRYLRSEVNEVLRELPRGTKIGSPKGAMWFRTAALGETLWINRQFFGDVRDVDGQA
jgi:hypothetical protein